MRAFVAVLLTLALWLPASAQTRTVVTNENALIQMPSMTTATSTVWYDVTAYGATGHVLTYTVSGSPSALAVALECSRDGGTTSYRIGTSTNVTGAAIRGAALCTDVRFTIDSIAGTGRLFPTWIGLTEAADSSAAIVDALRSLQLDITKESIEPELLRLEGLFGKPVPSDGWGLRVSTPPVANLCATHIAESTPVSQTATTRIVTGRPGYAVLVCHVRLVFGAADITSEWEGTGSACGTGTLARSGSTTAANGESFAANGGYSTTQPFMLRPGNDFCIAQSGSNRVSGKVSWMYVPAP
jgi:hypothetical protein